MSEERERARARERMRTKRAAGPTLADLTRRLATAELVARHRAEYEALLRTTRAELEKSGKWPPGERRARG